MQALFHRAHIPASCAAVSAITAVRQRPASIMYTALSPGSHEQGDVEGGGGVPHGFPREARRPSVAKWAFVLLERRIRVRARMPTKHRAWKGSVVMECLCGWRRIHGNSMRQIFDREFVSIGLFISARLKCRASRVAKTAAGWNRQRRTALARFRFRPGQNALPFAMYYFFFLFIPVIFFLHPSVCPLLQGRILLSCKYPSN